MFKTLRTALFGMGAFLLAGGLLNYTREQAGKEEA